MVYNSRNSGGGGGSRYDGGSGYGGGGGGFQPRRDTSLRRSGGGSQFGALDLPISSGRQSFGSPSSSVSPWASGQGPTPTRHSWGGGGGAAVSDLGGRGGPDVFSQLGSVSSGGQSDTLNMATQLVSALLNQNQRQRAPQPFGGPAAPAPGPFGPPVPGYGARGAGGYRSARTSFDGGHAQYGHRADYNAKYDRRGEPFASPSRGRVTPRGRGAVARTRAAPYPSRSASATTGRSTGRQTADKSATKKKDQKKGVKTTQEAIDEAKAAALEKELEASDDKGKGAEGADLMSKDGAEGGKEGEAKADGDAKKGDAKDGEGKKIKPAKPQREKILPEHLNCTVCNVMNMKSEQTFNEHTRGRRHQQMMELVDQKLEMTAKLIRIEVQVGAKRAEQEAQRRNNGKVAKESGFCGMCNCKVYKDIQDHRFHDQLHAKLKKFLHPRCCGLGFETPVLYERHLISFTHFRKTQQREKDRAAAGSEALGVMGDPSSGTAAAAAAAAAKENGEAGADGAVAEGAAPAAEGAEGAATEGAEATAAATESAEGAAPAMEGVEAATEGQKPVKEPEAAKEPEKTIEDEEVPVTYDQDAEVATSAGVPFLGTFCTVCKLVMPDDFWSEHCRSRMHFTRFVVVRAAIDKAKKEAAEKEKKEAAEKEKKAAAAAAEEATEVTEVTVVEDEPESEETAAAGGEQRGTKRAAEEEEGAEAKKPATEGAPTDETGLDKMLDEMSEELDGKAAPAEEKAAEVVKEEAAAEVKTGEAAAEVKEEAPAEGDAEKTAEATTNGAEKPAEAAAVTEKPAAAAATTTPAKPAAAATPAKPAAATPAKPAAATPAKPAAATPAKPAASTPAKPAAATTPTGGAGNRGGNRGRGGRGGGGGGSPGRGGFARRRNRGRGGRF